MESSASRYSISNCVARPIGLYELVFGLLSWCDGFSYEQAWRVCTEMKQLQIKSLWERACWELSKFPSMTAPSKAKAFAVITALSFIHSTSYMRDWDGDVVHLLVGVSGAGDAWMSQVPLSADDTLILTVKTCTRSFLHNHSRLETGRVQTRRSIA